ncbi:MAG: type II secretion system F family protein [Nitrospinaceae bacterium]
MTVYFYQATDKSGKLIEGDIEASDYRMAVQRVRGLNYFPIKVSEEKPKKSLALVFKLPGTGLHKRISPKELMTFTQQLSTLVDAGLTLDRSLTILAQLTEKQSTRDILADIQKKVHSGSSFADALADYSQVFSKLYINMIRAGETGGTLGTILDRLGVFMEKTEDLKANIRSAMIYPSILTLVGGSAVVLLITVVIPKFSKLFDEMGQALPLPTKIMLTISSIITNHWLAILLAFSGGVAGFILYLNSERGRLKWDRLVLKLPIFGSLVRKIEISRFSRTMSTLLKSGVPILQSLTIVRSILTNRAISAAMDPLHKGLKEGEGLSKPLQQANVFPPMAVHMITLGEESGSLDDMLAKVSDTYDKEVERSIKQLLSLIEPVMILLMAIVIGFIVISMLMAIFSVNEMAF